jgi:Flp pilus assembly protein TadB
MLHARRRGVPRDLKEVEEEAAQMPERADVSVGYFDRLLAIRMIDCASFLMCGVRAITTHAMIYATIAMAIAILIAILYHT